MTVSRALTVALLVVLAGCGGEPQELAPAPVAVVAEPPQWMVEQLEVEAIGSARAEVSARLYPEAGGLVQSVRFSSGDFVRAGEPLVELDSRRERLAVELAEVRVQEAAQLLERYRRIEDTGAISLSQIEAGETALATARLALEQARTDLADRTVRAPFAGHIGLTEVDPGDRIGPDTAIAQLDRRSTLFVDFAAPEAAFTRLVPGQTVTVSPFAEPDLSVEARVITVGSVIAPGERSYTVRTAIDNSADRLRPGMSFRVRFTGSGAQRVAVPEQAIVWGGEGAYLWVVREEQARRVPLTITSRREGMVLIDAPLDDNELVIVAGMQKVREGQAVDIVRPRGREPAEVRIGAASDLPAAAGGGGTRRQ